MFGRLNASECAVSVWEYLDKWNLFILILAVLFCTTLPIQLVQKIKPRMNPKAYAVVRDVLLILLFLFSAMTVVTNTYKTFIYFQF